MSTPRVVQNMPDAEYRAMPGLSHSAMKDLAISPLRFWYNHVRPDREPIEPTDFMIFGQALHSATLDEEATFDAKFCCEYVPPEGALTTVPQMREWYELTTTRKPKGTRKEDVAAQCREVPGCPPIVMDEEKRHFAQNQGKQFLKLDDWIRLAECTVSLNREPEFQRLKQGGKNEVSYFVTDPETGVALKARMDLVTANHTLDPKSFSSKGKTIDRAVCDAIYYEGYNRQAFLYTKIRHLAGEGVPAFYNVFVESEQPHEVRIKKYAQKNAEFDSLLWSRARVEVTRLIRLYADCWSRFGVNPWRTDAAVEETRDEEFRGLSWD